MQDYDLNWGLFGLFIAGMSVLVLMKLFADWRDRQRRRRRRGFRTMKSSAQTMRERSRRSHWAR